MASSQSSEQPTKNHSRDYKCSCGKTYLSNPALFTHIKLKHGGKAPGPVEKPKLEGKKRGRPRRQKLSAAQGHPSQDIPPAKDKNSEENSQLTHYKFDKLLNVFKSFEPGQLINPNIYTQRAENQQKNVFEIFSSFMDDGQITQADGQKPCVGVGLSEFLKGVIQLFTHDQAEKSQQLILLFMLLLEHMIDFEHDAGVLHSKEIKELAFYEDHFINNHIEDYAEHLNLHHLWVMRKENYLQIFSCFNDWLHIKHYPEEFFII